MVVEKEELINDRVEDRVQVTKLIEGNVIEEQVEQAKPVQETKLKELFDGGRGVVSGMGGSDLMGMKHVETIEKPGLRNIERYRDRAGLEYALKVLDMEKVEGLARGNVEAPIMLKKLEEGEVRLFDKLREISDYEASGKTTSFKV